MNQIIFLAIITSLIPFPKRTNYITNVQHYCSLTTVSAIRPKNKSYSSLDLYKISNVYDLNKGLMAEMLDQEHF